MPGLQLVKNDIRKEPTDVIVTPASRFARIGTGLDRLIHAAAGHELLKARKSLGHIAPGQVEVTESFNLKQKTGARWIIHTLGPEWDENSDVRDEHLLELTYIKIMLKAAELEAETVTIPVLSSGRRGMPLDKALDVAVKAIKSALPATPNLTVKLMGIDNEFKRYAIDHRLTYFNPTDFTSADEFAITKEYGVRGLNLSDLDDRGRPEVDRYSLKRQFERDTKGKSFREMFRILWDRKRTESRQNGGNLKTRKALAKATGISEATIRHYSEKDPEGREKFRTSKDKAVALAIVLGLSLEYTEALLGTIGERLNPFALRDKIIIDSISSGDKFVSQLNMTLKGNGVAPLDVADTEDLL